MNDRVEELVLERRGHVVFSETGENEERSIKIEILICGKVREGHI